ncbi:MAG: hypothetical protein ACR2NB_10080 [Solirubrobacteraceae bacterium]
MRLATLIISLVLMLISGIQSCAVAAGGSLAADLSTAAKDKQEAADLSGAGGAGVLAALMWLVAAGLVMSRPKASTWIFGVASLFWLGAGAAGFSDGFIWMVASLIFTAMSWRGIKEFEATEEQQRARYQADVAAAAATQRYQPPPPPPPRSP